ncbi:MAG: hypothetical protein FJ090_10700 [Deltaproteobacteria bacterium]|nr:hypothetical protein [Deltaproteobacteria bacterium]
MRPWLPCLALACSDYEVVATPADAALVGLPGNGWLDSASGSNAGPDRGDEGAGTVGAPECREDYSSSTLVSFDAESLAAYEIDLDQGAARQLALLSGASDPMANLNSSAFREDGLAFVSASGVGELWLVDPCTGAAEVVGATGRGDVCGIAFGPGGELFGLDRTSDELVRFDQSTGAAATVGPLGIDIELCGLAYDCVDEELFGVDSATRQLFAIDNHTGAATRLVPTTVPFQSVGLEYDPADRSFLASTGTELWRVVARTGESTRMSALPDGTTWDDLAYSLVELECASGAR